MSSSEAKGTFFKQSGWMMIATVVGGACMMAVHTVAQKMDPAGKESIYYSDFFALLRSLVLLSIPTAGLQTIFTQQAAAATGEKEHRQLTCALRSWLGLAFAIWLAMAAALFVGQSFFVDWLKIHNISALWVTMLTVLGCLFTPIVRGVLQGQQNFFGLGWTAILDGAGRLVALAAVIFLFHGKAAGAMAAVLIGQVISIGAAFWFIRKTIVGPSEKFPWKDWLKRFIPLTCGLGALAFAQNADVVFVKKTFSEADAALYMPASMIGFALIQFVGPLTMVMYPKVVRSLARSEKTDALKLTFLTTAMVGGCGSLVATVFPELPIRIIYANDPRFLASAAIVPWFSWSMSINVLAVVLITNLLAREKYAIVPWMVILAAAYVGALNWQQSHLMTLAMMDALRRVVQTLCTFSLVLVGLAAWFTWGGKRPRVAQR